MLKDITPILCLDASARVRTTYKQQQEASNNVTFLGGDERVKKYEKVTVRFEDGKAGRPQKGKRYKDKMKQIADIIKAHPDKIPLILHHKFDPLDRRFRKTPDYRGEIISHLTEEEQERTMFCTWGCHTASNDYQKCNLVITASILTYPPEMIEARGRASLDVPVNLEYDKDRMREMRRGEIKHDLYQGLARGSLRNCEGDQAEECLIYVMASRNAGIKSMIPDIFPGCNLIDGWWSDDIPKPITGKKLDLYNCIINHLENTEKITYPALCEIVGIKKTHLSNYIKDLTPHLDNAGYVISNTRPKFISKGDLN